MKKLRAFIPDTLLIVGAMSLTYGAWVVTPAAGYLVAGVLLIAGGIVAQKAA